MVFLEALIEYTISKCTKGCCRMAVDRVWDTYDANDNGVLEKDEVRRMITDILETFGQQERFDEDTFSNAFDVIDHDRDGDIEREQV